jgi:hypothetical protein
MASHLAFLWMTGQMPREVDHANRYRDDNRWDNLREASRSQNCCNRSATRTRHRDLPRGVYRQSGSIIAKIKVEQKQIYLGAFPTVAEAHAAYLEAARKHQGEFMISEDAHTQEPR